MNFEEHLRNIADCHWRKSDLADTPEERIHWRYEAVRFEELADLARISESAAKRAYRPTRAYEPEAVA